MGVAPAGDQQVVTIDRPVDGRLVDRGVVRVPALDGVQIGRQRERGVRIAIAQRVSQRDDVAGVREEPSAARERRHLPRDVTRPAVADEVRERTPVVVPRVGVFVDRPRDVRSTETGVDVDSEVDSQPIFDAVDDDTTALATIALDPLDLRLERVRWIDAVPQEVHSFAPCGFDPEFDTVDERHAVAFDDGVRERLQAIVVGESDDGNAGLPGGVGDRRQFETSVGSGRVNVEVGVDHTRPERRYRQSGWVERATRMAKVRKVYGFPEGRLWTMFIIIVHAVSCMQLNGAGDLIDAHDYPATTNELIEAYGERDLELPNGSETMGDALDRLENETFESPEEARFAVYSAMSQKAVGRVGYSDRDPHPPGSPYTPDAVSF